MSEQVPPVVVVGSANMDLVVRTPHFPGPGETVLGKEFATFAGGKGANQACAIGKLGGASRFIGMVGDDAFGTSLSNSLIESGVDTSGLDISSDLPTGTALITIDGSGENTIVVSSGANALVTPEFVRKQIGLCAARTLLVQLEIPVASVLAAAEISELTILNPAPAAELPAELLQYIAWITPNESEVERMTGQSIRVPEDCPRAATWFLDRGLDFVAITLGERGSFLMGSGLQSYCPTISIEAVDSTGAGDAFNGALAMFLHEGREPENAVRLANLCGALAATKVGAQASLPSLTELRSVAGELY